MNPSGRLVERFGATTGTAAGLFGCRARGVVGDLRGDSVGGVVGSLPMPLAAPDTANEGAGIGGRWVTATPCDPSLWILEERVTRSGGPLGRTEV